MKIQLGFAEENDFKKILFEISFEKHNNNTRITGKARWVRRIEFKINSSYQKESYSMQHRLCCLVYANIYSDMLISGVKEAFAAKIAGIQQFQFLIAVERILTTYLTWILSVHMSDSSHEIIMKIFWKII